MAAYCRVSSSSEDQLNSFAAQNIHYTQYITEHEDWRLVDIYADEGITGTSVEKRDDFKRMLADSGRGLIDRILVKSIARFARNTSECLEAIRQFRANGTTIFFEKENIDTARMSSELIHIQQSSQKLTSRKCRPYLKRKKRSTQRRSRKADSRLQKSCVVVSVEVHFGEKSRKDTLTGVV